MSKHKDNNKARETQVKALGRKQEKSRLINRRDILNNKDTCGKQKKVILWITGYDAYLPCS